MRYSCGAVFIDQGAGFKTPEVEWCVQFVRSILGDGMSKYPAGSRRGLKATRAPPTIEIKAVDRRFADNRAGVRANVDNASPHSQHAHTTEYREEFENRLHGMFYGWKTAALSITQIGIDACADDQLTLVRLADIAMYRIRHDHRIDYRFDRLGNLRLQWMTFDGQAQSGQQIHAG